MLIGLRNEAVLLNVMKRQLIHRFVMFSLGLCLSLVLQGTCINYPSVAIPDGDQNGVSNTILNTGSNGMLGTESFLSEVCLLIKHPKLDDVDILLTSPSGTTIELSTDNGGSFADYGDVLTAGMVCFSPLGSGGTILGYLGGTAGEFSPETPFTLFNGENPNGAWTITVADDDPFFTGFLLSWSISFSSGDCFKDTGDNPIVPIEPPTVDFSGLESQYCSDDDLVLLVGQPLPTPAIVESYDLSGAGFQIIDGSSTSISSSSISVTEFEEEDIVFNDLAVAVSINMSHPWVGDLIIQLVSPCGNVIDLIDRPGHPEGSWGSGSDMIGTYTFTNSASFLFPEEGVGQNAVIPNGSYLPADSFVELLGCELNGDWSLIIQDPILGGSGFVTDWQLHITLDQPATTGVFLGGGITNLGNGTAYFDPGLAEIDPLNPNVILYSYTHTDGLPYTDSDPTVVYQTPELAPMAPLEICGMGPSLNLADYQTADIYGQTGTYLWFQDSTLTLPLVNPTITEPGTYWLQFTSEYTCPTISSIVVTQLPDPIATINTPPTFCAGDVVSLTGASLTMGTSILYEWTGPDNFTSDQPTITNLTTAGLYELTVIVDDCISFPATHNLVINALPEPVFDNPFTEICPESTTQTYTLQGAYSNYEWTVLGGVVTGGGTPNNSVTVEWDATATGSINVTVTDALGCIGSQELLVDKHTTPVVSFGMSASEFCTGYPVTFRVESGFDSYQWSSSAGIVQTSPTGADSLVVSFGAPGMATVSVVVVDENGCSATADLNVTILDDLMPALVDPIVNVCIEDDGVVYTLAQNYLLHEWTVVGGTIMGDSTSNSISVSWGDTPGPGMVSVYVEVDNGCSGTLDLPVELLTPPPFSFVGDLQACEGSTGNIYSVTGAFSAYSWSVENGTITSGVSTDSSIEVEWEMNGAQTGTISLIVEDALSCTLVNEYEVEIIALPSLEFISSTDSTVCAFDEDLTYTLDGISDNMSWSVTGGNPISGGGMNDSTITVSWNGSGTGLIAVDYNDANGCASSTQLNIEIQDFVAPLWSVTTTELCDSTLSTYELASIYDSYNWTIDGGTIVGGDSTAQTVTVQWGQDDGQVTVDVSMLNGCSGTLIEDVELFNPPTAILEAGADTVCASEQNVPYVLTAGYDTYNIVVTGGVANQDAANPHNFTVNWSDDAVGQISVEILNAQACSQQLDLDIVINPAPEFTISANDPELCFEGSTRLLIDNPTEGVIYTWEPASLLTMANAEGTEIVLEPLSADTEFTATAMDPIGCAFEASLIVDVRDELIIDATLSYEAVCTSGDSITLTGNGADVYELIPMDGASIETINSFTVFPQSTIVYQLVGTDPFGCIDTIEVEVEVFEPASIETMDTLTIGICENVTLMPAVSGGTGAMSYEWSPADGLSAVDVLNPVADPLTTTTYYLTLTDEKGCSAETEVVVEVIDLPVIAIAQGSDIHLCPGAEATLVAQGGQTYNWTGPGIISQSDDEVVISLMSSGILEVTGTDQYGCSSTATVNVEVSNNLIASVSDNQSICFGESVQLFAGGGSNFDWFEGDGLDNNGIFNPTATPTETTTYKVVVWENVGCIDTAEVTITVIPLPVLEVGMGGTICGGEVFQLENNEALNYDKIVWQTSGTGTFSDTETMNPIYTPSAEDEGDIQLSFNLESQCGVLVKYIDIYIDRPSLEIELTQDIFQICEGETIDLEAFQNESATISWSGGTGNFSNPNSLQTSFEPTTVGMQELYFTADQNCESVQVPVLLDVLPVYELTASETQNIVYGEEVQLNVLGDPNDSYIWSPAEGLSCSDCPNPMASPESNTIYTVSSTTSCTVETSVNVFVNTDVNFLVPTAFSPNGDGMNDVLKVFGGAWELESFTVFNRYGQTVFQSKDNSGWDGSFKGKMQEAGVYVVVAEYISRIDGRASIYKGNVTLIH